MAARISPALAADHGARAARRLFCCLLFVVHGTARADDAFDMKAALDTRLAYVITGVPDVDAMSKAGLNGLGPSPQGAHLL